MATSDSGHKGILFVCRGNSVRSQMAEGLARAAAPEGIEVWSAGTHPIGLDDRAVAVMKEVGIDISGQTSKSVGDVPLGRVDLVVVLCGGADDPCPQVSAGVDRLHWPLPDPYLTVPAGPDGLDTFRRVRNELKDKITGLFRQAAP
ncbi:hypothetical protein AMJ57_02235 [Parcubacteria bacterium SG8_24]|nr:MAG: hypothetical protein AMJ57_02235 [Parcubacteria bacterium SG8_24]